MEQKQLDGRDDEWPPEVIEQATRGSAAREAVRQRHPSLFAAVSEAMFRHDPIGINFESNADEYDPEAGIVLPRLSACASVSEVENVLREEFCRWFGADIACRAKYLALAKEVWKLWTKTQAKPGWR